MQFIKELKNSKTYIGRLNFNDDLLEELNKLALKLNIKAGQIKAIGALQEASFGFYKQEEKKYAIIHLKQDLEDYQVTRLATGLPFGCDIHYSTSYTLANALKRRFSVHENLPKH